MEIRKWPKPVHPTSVTGQILVFLAGQSGRWATWGKSFYMPSVQAAFETGTESKVQFRFMRYLQRKGLVGGCDCGCRGDYAITLKGLEFIANDCLTGQQELDRWNREKYMLGY